MNSYTVHILQERFMVRKDQMLQMLSQALKEWCNVTSVVDTAVFVVVTVLSCQLLQFCIYIPHAVSNAISVMTAHAAC